MNTGTDPRSRWLAPAVLIATGFGIGRMPAMPGTFGTLWAIPIFAAMQAAGLSMMVQLALAVLVAAICVPISTLAEKAIGGKDPGCIVCDEYASFLLVLVCVPESYQYWIGSFLLFRLFDIAKPWPIRIAQNRLKSGLGIVADDLLAALYTITIAWIVASQNSIWE